MNDHSIYLLLIIVVVVLAGFFSAGMALISMWEDLLEAIRSRKGNETDPSR